MVPAAHYHCGGLRVDLAGRTSVPNLYAAGEVSCTGLHGANRLASTSLLEALVWGKSVAREVNQTLGLVWSKVGHGYDHSAPAPAPTPSALSTCLTSPHHLPPSLPSPPHTHTPPQVGELVRARGSAGGAA